MSLAASLRSRRSYFLLSLGVLLLDQASKWGADRLLTREGPRTIVPGVLNLWYSRNRGGLFGYFSEWGDPWRSVLLTLFPLVAIALIAWFLARADEQSRSTLAGLSLILGGAAGNLVDRVLRGEVVDFVDVYASWTPVADWLLERFGTVHWPTFNLADSAIVIGALLLVLDILRPEHAGEAPAGESAQPPDVSAS